MGRLLRGISKNGGVIFTALDSTDIVRKMREYHDTSAVTSAALGRLLTAAGLMGTMLKQKKNTVTLRVDGGGPAGILLAVADGAGHVLSLIHICNFTLTKFEFCVEILGFVWYNLYL